MICCQDWEDNAKIVNDLLIFAVEHDFHRAATPFRYCPYCREPRVSRGANFSVHAIVSESGSVGGTGQGVKG